MGAWSLRWRSRKLTCSEASTAECSPTGIDTRPKVRCPLQIERAIPWTLRGMCHCCSCGRASATPPASAEFVEMARKALACRTRAPVAAAGSERPGRERSSSVPHRRGWTGWHSTRFRGKRMGEAAASHADHPRPSSRGLRILGWLVLVIALLGIAMAIVNAVIDEPLRRTLERRINAALTGYTVTIGKLDLHLFGFAVELDDVTVVQNARPRPPVIYIPRWTTRVEFRALLSLAVVADTHFDRPQVFFTQDQAVTEARDPVPVTDKGWQDAVTAVYPLKINTLRVSGGTVTYHDQ